MAISRQLAAFTAAGFVALWICAASAGGDARNTVGGAEGLKATGATSHEGEDLDLSPSPGSNSPDEVSEVLQGLGMIIWIDGNSTEELKRPVIKQVCSSVPKSTNAHCDYTGAEWALIKSSAGSYGSYGQSYQRYVEDLLYQLSKRVALPPNTHLRMEANLKVVTTALHVQDDAPLNLGRLDQAANTGDYEYKYMTTGVGVTVYVLDKGINGDHEDFQKGDESGVSRVTSGTTTFTSDSSCGGHGTHVAGIVGGLQLGVAKDVDISMVQVQPCSEDGNVAYLLKGMDWLLGNVKYPAVAQMSLLALGTSKALNDKVQEIINARIPFVLSAGNYAADACNYSPAMVEGAIVVGNVDSNDELHSTSNYGSCVDLFAPGSRIPGPSDVSNTETVIMTGTSQAAPHVSGVVAQYFERVPHATVDMVMSHLLNTAAYGKIENTKGSPNYLLQTDLSPVGPVVMVSSTGAPGMSVTPGNIDVVNLFENTNQSTGAHNLTITNFKDGTLVYNASAQPVGNTKAENWLKVSRAKGSLNAGESGVLTLTFDSKKVGQGVYQADLLIDSNDVERPRHTVRVVMRVFCERLQGVRPATVDFRRVNVTHTRPSGWGPESAGGDPPSAYLEGVLIFSQPTVNDDPALPFSQLTEAISVQGAGFVETVQSGNIGGPMCSSFLVRARAPLQDAWKRRTDVCIELREGKVRDVYGKAVPKTTLCSGLDQGPKGKIFGAYMTYASDEGLMTDETEVLLVAAFTERVKGLSEDKFYVEASRSSGFEFRDLKPVEGTNKFYHVTLAMPSAYEGHVQVGMATGVTDVTGNTLSPVAPLEFKRVARNVVQHTAHRVISSA